MPRQFLTSIDLAKSEIQNAVVHQLAAPPGSPARGQLYFNTGDNTMYYCENPTGPVWVAAKSGAPSAHGSSHNFGGGDAIAANGAVGTPTLRKLGTGATDAAAGDDSRFTNARTPTAHASTHQPGGGDAMAADQADATASLRTLGQTSGKAMPGTTRLNGILAPTADVAMASFKITGLADGTAANDAVNRQQLDTAIQGLDGKQSVKMASTANLGLTGLAAIDGITPIAGDRILAKNQTTTSQNGIYTAASGAWTRATDMDTWAEVPDAYTWVEQGSLNADTGWLCTSVGGGTIGTNPITWTQFSGAGQISAGAGMTKSGSQLDVGAGTGISVAADSVAVDTGVIATVASLASYVPTTRNLATTAPLTGGGTLAADKTLAITSFAGSTPGAVPTSPGGTTTFLRADGTWNAPAGGGTVNKYALATVGGATSQVITHSLGSKDVIVQLYRNASPFDQVECDVEHTSTTQVTLRFAVAPATNAYSVVVTG